MGRRRVFYSFHFKNDFWRTNQVRNIGAVEGSKPVSGNAWEEVKRKGDANIKRWIDGQLKGRSCTVVLVGSQTANRKWVKYEIRRSWELGMGVCGVRIHGLLDGNRKTSASGANPFVGRMRVERKPSEIGWLYSTPSEDLGDVVELHAPWDFGSKWIYNSISANIADWIEEAINMRSKYK